MSNPDSPPPPPAPPLVARRVVRAPCERVFAAWTDPVQLTRWWGPAGASCPEAHVDLRPGGEYRIANRFPDGHVVWIRGRFETIEPPHRLVYTWAVEGDPTQPSDERVTVSFEARPPDFTEIVVTHERIANEERRQSHAAGWAGCLEGLAAYVHAFS
jgi:uncharacterized protein YndB with AHSA1/START domain